jgi:hypothetical protein
VIRLILSKEAAASPVSVVYSGSLSAIDSAALRKQLPSLFSEFATQDGAFRLECMGPQGLCRIHMDSSLSRPDTTHISMTGTGQYLQSVFHDPADKLKLRDELLFPLSNFESSETVLQPDITGQPVRVPRFSLGCFTTTLKAGNDITCLSVWALSENEAFAGL